MNEPSSTSLECPVPADSGDVIELAHGGGGRLTQRLIDTLFRPAFGEAPDDFTHDGATLDAGDGDGDGARLAFTTDSYVVRPLFFPGGDIGSLAVNGTVNDLAMCGAQPKWLSAGFVIEEGLALDALRRIVQSMHVAARAAGVRIVTGDTKVVERGRGDGLYLNTSGVGIVRAGARVAPQRVRPGDVAIVSGDVGRHGVAILAVREGLAFETALVSDCAPLAAPVASLFDAGIEPHCLRDLTRGGLATALIEIAHAGDVSIRIDGAAIPVCEPVLGACEMLGLDPLYVANEGRFVAFVAPADAERALARLRRFDEATAVIGYVDAKGRPGVRMTTLGGSRELDLPSGEQLPRIC